MNKITLSPAIIGFLRGLGMVALLAVLTYLGNAANLTGIVTPVLATLIASAALAFENSLTAKTGNALLGAVKQG